MTGWGISDPDLEIIWPHKVLPFVKSVRARLPGGDTEGSAAPPLRRLVSRAVAGLRGSWALECFDACKADGFRASSGERWIFAMEFQA